MGAIPFNKYCFCGKDMKKAIKCLACIRLVAALIALFLVFIDLGYLETNLYKFFFIRGDPEMNKSREHYSMLLRTLAGILVVWSIFKAGSGICLLFCFKFAHSQLIFLSMYQNLICECLLIYCVVLLCIYFEVCVAIYILIHLAWWIYNFLAEFSYYQTEEPQQQI